MLTVTAGAVVVASVVMCITGLSGAAAAPTPDQQRCSAPDPDVSIGGCTAMIQSDQETQENLAKAFLNRGFAYDRKGQYDRAIEDYDQAIKLNPNFVLAFVDRGDAYNSKHEYDRAIQDLDQAIKLDPNFAPAFYNRGNAYDSELEYDRAVRDYDQAIKLDPNFAAAFYQRGNALRALGQESRAAADFAKARELNPNLPSALPAPSPSMAKFLSTPEHVTAAQAAAINAFKQLEDCNDVTATPIIGSGQAVDTSIGYAGVQGGAPQFDAAGNLLSGLIKEQFAASGCGKHRLENIFTGVKDGRIFVVAKIPGTTHADPLLVHDTLMEAYQAAAMRIGSCQKVRFVDTSFEAFEGEPNPRAKSQMNGGRPWREIWTLDICGSPTQVIIHYIPDETGTTIVSGPITPQTPPVSPPPQPTVAASHSSVADLLERGRKAHAEKNYREEMRWFRKAADQGDAAAQINVGGLYANGWGVPQNYPEAMRWFRKAADQGNAAAQNDVGGLFANGRGVPRDDTEAMRWFQMAAAQGYAPAQDNIGALYENGSGVSQDYAEAMRWFRMAADRGFVVAQNKIGVLYQRGWGVSQDYGEAMRWYQMAAAQGNAPAQVNIGRMIARGWGLGKDCTAAKPWFEKAAAAGDEVARGNLRTGAEGACPW